MNAKAIRVGFLTIILLIVLSAAAAFWQDCLRLGSVAVSLLIACLALAAAALFLYSEKMHRKTINEEEQKLRESEEKYRIAISQSNRSVFRYNLTAEKKGAFLAPTRRLQDDMDVNNVEALIAGGGVAEESIEPMRAFFAKIADGESPVTADFQLIDNAGKWRWFRFTSTTLFAGGGKRQNAIISYYDCTELRFREQAYAKWKQEKERISKEKSALFEWNLTRDVIENESGELIPFFKKLPSESFDRRMGAYIASRVYGDDKASLGARLSRERLIGAYHSKIYQDAMDYREALPGGLQRWMRLVVQLVPYPDSQDVKAYVILKDIDREKREELKLLSQSQLDSMTGAYNRATFVLRVNELFSAQPGAMHALLMIDLDGFKNVNDALGHEAGDQTLIDATQSIRSVLRACDLVGRLGGDEFAVCLAGIPFDDAIAKKAAQLCAGLRQRVYARVPVSASIGVAVFPRDGASFEELYQKADAALYTVKNNGKDGYAFAGGGRAGRGGAK